MDTDVYAQWVATHPANQPRPERLGATHRFLLRQAATPGWAPSGPVGETLCQDLIRWGLLTEQWAVTTAGAEVLA